MNAQQLAYQILATHDWSRSAALRYAASVFSPETGALVSTWIRLYPYGRN